MERDPVCGMEVDPQTAEYKSDYEGKTYYFCSQGCKQDFDREPDKYLNAHEHGDEHMHHH